jgi:hypothetical protein
MGAIHLLNELPDDLGAGRIGQLRQLAEMLVSGTTRRETLSRRAYENCSFSRLTDVDQLFTDVSSAG